MTKKIFRFITYSSVVLNICYFIAWVYAFNTNDVFEDKVSTFSALVPVPGSITITTALLFVLSILSIVLAGNYNILTRSIVIMQALFTFYYTWQLL